MKTYATGNVLPGAMLTVAGPALGGATNGGRAESWQGRVFFNTPIETQPSYGLVHLRAAFEPRSHRWEVAVYARTPGRSGSGLKTGVGFQSKGGVESRHQEREACLTKTM